MAEFSAFRVRFKCPDGIQFEFFLPCEGSISLVRKDCELFVGLFLPSVFKPCSYDVKIQVIDFDPSEDGILSFSVHAFQALCRSLRTPYLFNSKFYRYALKNKEKQSSKA